MRPGFRGWSTPRLGLLLAAAVSAIALTGALGSQYLGGLAPCELCLWQRWPYALVLGLGLPLALAPLNFRLHSLALGLGLVGILTSGGIGLFHAGVEQGWWKGLEACGSQMPAGLTPAEMLAWIKAQPVVRCTDIPWSFAGLSIAAWNAVYAAGAALALALLFLRPHPLTARTPLS